MQMPVLRRGWKVESWGQVHSTAGLSWEFFFRGVLSLRLSLRKEERVPKKKSSSCGVGQSSGMEKFGFRVRKSDPIF